MNRPVVTIRKGTDAQVASMRAQMSGCEVVDARKNKTWPLDVFLWWVVLFGIWPIAHPEHNFDTLAGAGDVVAHFAAIWALCARWRFERRYRS